MYVYYKYVKYGRTVHVSNPRPTLLGMSDIFIYYKFTTKYPNQNNQTFPKVYSHWDKTLIVIMYRDFRKMSYTFYNYFTYVYVHFCVQKGSKAQAFR